MYRGTKDIMLPTTITGSLPRPSWYTREPRHARSFVKRWSTRVSASNTPTRSRAICATRNWPGSTSSPTATRISTPTSAARAGPPIRRHHMGGSRHRRSPMRRRPDGRHPVPARPHPARLSGSARHADDHRPGRRAASCNTRRDVEDGAAPDHEAGEIRHHHGRARRLRAARPALQEPAASASSPSPTRCNEELHELADAGCPVIQIEEPQIHLHRGPRDSVEP